MKRIIWTVIIFMAVVTIALVFLRYSKPAPKAASLLPGDTLLFLRIPNVARARDNFAQTKLSALCREPEMQRLLDGPTRALREMLGLPERSDADDRLLGLMEGEAFIAVTQVALAPKPQAALAVGVDVKRKKLEARAAIALLEHHISQRNPDAMSEPIPYLGVKYTAWYLRPDVTVYHAFFNSLLIFTLDEDTMRDLIARFTGQTTSEQRSLASNKDYQKLLERMPHQHELFAFLNLARARALAAPLLMFAPPELTRLNAWATSVTFVEGNIQEVNVTAYSTPTGEKLPALARDTLELTTPQTSFYSARHARLAALYSQLMDTIALSGQADAIAAAARVRQAIVDSGVRLQDDVLAHLGPEIAVIGNWRKGARSPDFALVARTDGVETMPQALDATFDALKNTFVGPAEQAPWDQTTHLGCTLRTFTVGAGIIAPTYTVTDKFFILASTPDYARELVTQAKQHGPTLLADDRFRRLSEPFPANATVFTYCDLGAVIEPMYTLGRNSAAELGRESQVRSSLLPRTETITGYLSPCASVTVTEPTSETTTTVSPLGTPAIMVLGAGSVALTMQPYLVQLPFFSALAPKTSSSKDVPLRPRESRTAPSQTPATQ